MTEFVMVPRVPTDGLAAKLSKCHLSKLTVALRKQASARWGEYLALAAGECPECHKYVGHCPACHSPCPRIATPTPPAPDMEVVREWEAATRGWVSYSSGGVDFKKLGDRMAAALSAQARKIEGLERVRDAAIEASDKAHIEVEELSATVAELRAEVERIGGEREDWRRRYHVMADDRADLVSQRDILNGECALAETQRDAAREALATVRDEALMYSRTRQIADAALKSLPDTTGGAESPS